jgi:hypothetical protein
VSDPYQSHADAELVLDHIANPEQFTKVSIPAFKHPTQLTIPELIERIATLEASSHPGTWKDIKLSEAHAEATRRKLNLTRK